MIFCITSNMTHNIKLIFSYASMKKAAQWSSNLIFSCEFKFEYLQTFTHQIMLVLRRICLKCYIISNILCFLNNVNTFMLMVTGSQGSVVRSCADYWKVRVCIWVLCKDQIFWQLLIFIYKCLVNSVIQLIHIGHRDRSSHILRYLWYRTKDIRCRLIQLR